MATVFGAGGATSSYKELQETDIILLWGSNARETHPIMFHHMLQGVRNGARMVVIDPRRTPSAGFAHRWLPVRVGSDIALANAMGRVIIHEGLLDREFVEEATEGFETYAAAVEAYTLEWAESITGVPRDWIAQTAREYAQAPTGVICWTLGITEHHTAVDNALSLINLALLTGKIGRYGCGLNPLRGQNNVQGGGDMGALPNKFVGFQDVTDDAIRRRFEGAWTCEIPGRPGRNQTQILEGMESGEVRAAYIIGENPIRSDANASRVEAAFDRLDFLVVQDIFLTATGRRADVLLPAAVGWCETDGTVTNSERRVLRCRKALEPPGEAKDDIWIVSALAERLGRRWEYANAEAVWEEVRRLSPMHRGMSYLRIEAEGGVQWPCPEEDRAGELFLHGRLWERPVSGERAPFSAVEWSPPAERPDAEYPMMLTTGRRLEAYNTGVQTSLYKSPKLQDERVVLHPDDALSLGVATEDRVRVTSRRGSLIVRVAIERSVAPGLCFMTLHFPERVNTNLLTGDTTDPKSGTAEFKATAVRIERVESVDAGSRGPEEASVS